MSDPAHEATLYVVPGSHPSMAGRLMLEHKRMSYRRVDLMPALHKPILRALGFDQTTVPALRIRGLRVQHTPTISRVLEEIQADPPLFPADADERAAVEDAERWGERVLQPIPRRLSWWALQRDRSPLRSFAEGAHLGVPLAIATRTAAPIVWAEVRINDASDAAVKADMAALPGVLDHVDRLLGDGVLGRRPPTAADYQIATSVRLLLCFADLCHALLLRPAGQLAMSLVPDFPGHLGPVIPPEWTQRLGAPEQQHSPT